MTPDCEAAKQHDAELAAAIAALRAPTGRITERPQVRTRVRGVMTDLSPGAAAGQQRAP